MTTCLRPVPRGGLLTECHTNQCADIILTSTATTLATDMCMNSTGVSAAVVEEQMASSGNSTATKPNAAARGGSSTLALAGVVAVMVALGFGSVL